LLRYITTARYPDNWRGTAFTFVLHWQEQVQWYKRLDLEAFPPIQKLSMIQNAVGEVTELAPVKQLADLGIANGQALTYNTYVDLLLEACSTFDKRRASPARQKCAVYSSVLSDNDLDCPYDHADDGQYEAYQVELTSQGLWHMLTIPINSVTVLEVIVKLKTLFYMQIGSR
jgi:hypothetical protein